MKKMLLLAVVLLVAGTAVSAELVSGEVDRVLGLRDIWNFKDAVYFSTAQAKISQQDQAVLKSVADALKNNSEAIIVLVGHADAQGKAAANQRLSERRAEAVKNVLVSRYGVERARIQTSGRGANDPVATNETSEGRAKNRRVEVRIQRNGDPNVGNYTPYGTDVTISGQNNGNPNVGNSTPAGNLDPMSRSGSGTPNIGNSFPAPKK